jgi:hypothetical protein
VKKLLRVSVLVIASGLALNAASASGAFGTSKSTKSTWTVKFTQNRPWPLDAISCPTAEFCVAEDGTTVQQTTNGGTRWTADPVEKNYTVYDVSCPKSHVCRGVGTKGGNWQSFMTETSASTWVASSKTVDEMEPTAVEAMSCPSVNECVAVGANNLIGGNSDGYPTWTATNLARSAGTSLANWKSALIPFTHGSIVVGLSSVSCPSVTTCYAISNNYDAGTILLRTTSSSASWSIVGVTKDGRVPVRELETSQFTDISCATTTSCTIVGLNESNRLLILQTHNGGASWRWTAESGPRRALEGDAQPRVSCASTSVCVVTDGYTFYRSSDAGASWVKEAAPHDAGLPISLSCPSVSRCFATTANGVVGSGSKARFPGHILVFKVRHS